MLQRPASGLVLIIGLLSLLFVNPAFAVFQDEAYNVDFAHTLFGTPLKRSTFFHRPDSVSKAALLYTLGEKGVLGAVNPRDGEIVWRALVNDTVPPRHEQGQGVLRAHESLTTVISGFGSTVRAWDAKDGRLVWERATGEKVKGLELLGLGSGQCDIVVLTEGGESGGSILRLSGADGGVKWRLLASKSDYPLGISISAHDVFLTSLSPASRGGYKTRVQTVDGTTGKEKSQYTLDTENDISSEASVMHVSGVASAPVLVWTDDKYKNLHFNVLGHKHTTIAMINPYGTDVFADISVIEHPDTGGAPHFLVQYNRQADHRAEVYHVDTKAGKINKAYDVESAAGRGSFGASATDADVFFIRHTTGKAQLYSSKSAKAIEDFPVKQDVLHAQAPTAGVYSVSELATRGENRYSVRTAVVTPDGDWTLYQNGMSAWTRAEGLSGIRAVAFVDIPAEDSLLQALSAESDSNFVSAYIHRVQRHLKDLRHFPAWARAVPNRFISSLTGIDVGDSTSPLSHDSYGFKKIIVVATERGRIAALGSANQGQILWSLQIPLSHDRKSWDVGRIDIQNGKAFVLAGNGEFVIVDAVVGTIVQHSTGTQAISYHVPVTGPDGAKSLLGVSEDGTPGVLPDGFPSSSHIVTRRADGSVAGWKPLGNGKTALAWSFVPRPGESIVSVSTKPAHDPVASVGRARGDRNVLYKFLSPNVVLVTASDVERSAVSVYLLDTISGQTLYTTTHENVNAGAVTPATISENWIAYSIFSDVTGESPAGSSTPESPVKGHQLIVSEFFESRLLNDRGPLGSTLNYSSLTAFYTPHVESVAYVLSAPVTMLGTTSTLQGITPRSLLAYSPALAALLAVPVPYLSPRRPAGRDPTQSEREEGLMRYQPHLDLVPVWFLSHKRELLGIDDVVASPTNMESSSLVFAFGDIDVFGTRISPIGTFDVLGAGFGKLQLVLTVLGLGVGTGLLAPLAKRKAIDGLWGK